MGVKDIWAKGALAEELDALSLDVTGVSDKIGESNDTGGTIAAGSLMAKANALLDSKGVRPYGGTKNFTAGCFSNAKLSTNSTNVIKAKGEGVLGMGFYSNLTSSVSLTITIDGVKKSFSGPSLSSGSNNIKYEFEFSKEISVDVVNTSTTTSAGMAAYYFIQYR